MRTAALVPEVDVGSTEIEARCPRALRPLVRGLLRARRGDGPYADAVEPILRAPVRRPALRETLSAVPGDVGTRILFRLGAVDGARMVAFEASLTLTELTRMPSFRAVAQMTVDNVPPAPFTPSPSPSP